MSESSSLTVDERLARAHTLREQALQLLHVAGGWQEIEGYPGKLRAYSDERLFVLHRTPFQPPPISDAAVAAGISAAAQRQAAREYGLDIWLDNRKVLCLIWNSRLSGRDDGQRPTERRPRLRVASDRYLGPPRVGVSPPRPARRGRASRRRLFRRTAGKPGSDA